MRKKYIVKPRLDDSGFPRSSKFYLEMHNKTDKLEKKKFPKGYLRMKKVDSKLGKHELSGKNSKTGKIYISKKVPKELRQEVFYHEKSENKLIRAREKKKR